MNIMTSGSIRNKDINDFVWTIFGYRSWLRLIWRVRNARHWNDVLQLWLKGLRNASHFIRINDINDKKGNN